MEENMEEEKGATPQEDQSQKRRIAALAVGAAIVLGLGAWLLLTSPMVPETGRAGSGSSTAELSADDPKEEPAKEGQGDQVGEQASEQAEAAKEEAEKSAAKADSSSSSKSQGGSSSSSSGSSSNSGSSSSGSNSGSSKPAHKHTPVEVTQTIHHDAVTHQEPVYNTVKVPYWLFAADGYKAYSEGEVDQHILWLHSQGMDTHYSVQYETRQELTGYQTVVDQAAWDEVVVVGHKCSSCGASL